PAAHPAAVPDPSNPLMLQAPAEGTQGTAQDRACREALPPPPTPLPSGGGIPPCRDQSPCSPTTSASIGTEHTLALRPAVDHALGLSLGSLDRTRLHDPNGGRDPDIALDQMLSLVGKRGLLLRVKLACELGTRFDPHVAPAQ